MEQVTLFISNLYDDKSFPIISTTVLKNEQGKKRTGNLNTLSYLFDFLNAYDFSGEGSEEIHADNKLLINASVLGLIFEKINGYKDGSFFTLGFITRLRLWIELLKNAYYVQTLHATSQRGQTLHATSQRGQTLHATSLPTLKPFRISPSYKIHQNR